MIQLAVCVRASLADVYCASRLPANFFFVHFLKPSIVLEEIWTMDMYTSVFLFDPFYRRGQLLRDKRKLLGNRQAAAAGWPSTTQQHSVLCACIHVPIICHVPLVHSYVHEFVRPKNCCFSKCLSSNNFWKDYLFFSFLHLLIFYYCSFDDKSLALFHPASSYTELCCCHRCYCVAIATESGMWFDKSGREKNNRMKVAGLFWFE